MKEQTIKAIIDYHLQKWIVLGLNALPGAIETEMAEPRQDKTEDWRRWYPIDSKVTDNEIEDFEKQVGHVLPADYKTFLKYKHFYELHIDEAAFTPHPVNIWRAKQVEMIFEGYPAECLIEKGYLPFANRNDWGLLCFDTNSNKHDKNYPIVLWDHEIADEFEPKYADFFDLMIKLDAEDKKNTS